MLQRSHNLERLCYKEIAFVTSSFVYARDAQPFSLLSH